MASTEAESSTAAVPGDRASEERAGEGPVASPSSPALYYESKQKVLELLKLYAEHGYVSLEETAAALGRSSELVSRGELVALKQRVREFEEALREARLANDLTRWELKEAELGLAKERELVKDSLVRIANLEGQLKDARRTTLKLIAASRNGLATLKRVRDHLSAENQAVGALAPLVHNFEELTQAVQELHALAVVKASTAPLQPGPH